MQNFLISKEPVRTPESIERLAQNSLSGDTGHDRSGTDTTRL
jgi:hypothetical protein